MAEMKGKSKRLPINLSFLTLTDSMKQIKSPRNFEEPNGVVGLGILAALNDDHHHNHALISNNGSRTTVLVLSPKSASSPIPIRNNFVSENDSYNKLVSAEKLDFCEGYTCVMSHVGKTEYFDAEIFGNNNVPPIVSVVFGTDVFGSPVTCGGETVAIGVADFLSSCFLCEKMLHGLDVFMYRGEKAFCSTECRHTQISIDEKKEKRRSGVRRSLKYSVSPCYVAAA